MRKKTKKIVSVVVKTDFGIFRGNGVNCPKQILILFKKLALHIVSVFQMAAERESASSSQQQQSSEEPKEKKEEKN